MTMVMVATKARVRPRQSPTYCASFLRNVARLRAPAEWEGRMITAALEQRVAALEMINLKGAIPHAQAQKPKRDRSRPPSPIHGAKERQT